MMATVGNTPLLVDGTPVISLAGWSGSGKTTLLEKLVERLSSAGLRVGVIKHHGHASSLEPEGKDTWRFSQAGASPVVASSPIEYTITRRTDCDLSLETLAQQIAPECDLILTEGFKEQIGFRIEVFREANGTERIFSDEEVQALVTDSAEQAQAAEQVGTPVFGLDDIEAIGEFIAKSRRALLEQADSAL